jgi:predicted  nucleic acid-binding Zn-ribbon protein
MKFLTYPFLLTVALTIYNRHMNRAHNLHRLQDIDLTIDRNKVRLVAITEILADDEQLDRAKDALERAEENLNAKRASLQRAEGSVSSQRFKIEQTEKTLYSGSVQNPRELQDLQQESESLNRYLTTLEDRLLDAMVAHEEAEFEYDHAQEQVERITQMREIEHMDLLKEQAHIMNDMVRLENDREAALAIVPADDLALYDRLRAKHKGFAVAQLDGGNCSLCGLSIGSSIQQKIRSGTELVQCSQCNRILYFG